MSPTSKILITLTVCFVVIAAGTVGVAILLWSRYGSELAQAGNRVSSKASRSGGRPTRPGA
jgi:hypothetical protein